MGILDHLTCLLRNLYAGQEATVRTGHGATDWFHIGKGVHQGYILSPCLFNLYAEYIMRNTRLEEAQAGIKISGRNINNLSLFRLNLCKFKCLQITDLTRLYFTSPRIETMLYFRDNAIKRWGKKQTCYKLHI